nr:RNA-directed DNA polymerase, eukaryota [Tanacetum cinerariifolium]
MVSDSFVAVYGTWIPSTTKLLDGKSILLGDFNEVRFEHERYAFVFNPNGANVFNNFIASSSLVDLPMDGFSFTWSHKSASKMSKLDRFLISDGLLAYFPSLSFTCLDKYLSDHRPILLRETNVDYGPYPFRFFNSCVSQLAICGILSDGDWIVDPLFVKREFHSHFSNRFAAPVSYSISFNHTFPRQLTADQMDDLERVVSYDEIKNAVWDCGTNKFLGPDGFTFEFFRKYWKIIDNDVVAAVMYFFDTGVFPPWCNSSFIALITKMHEAKMVKDFRPISLIGSIYKIITKVLANRLSHVISDLVFEEKSAFVVN